MSFSSAERDLELYRNIVEAFGFIKRYTDGIEQSAFRVDAKTQDAVAIRNKISHSYVDVDGEVVWEVIKDFDEFQKLIEWAQKNI